MIVKRLIVKNWRNFQHADILLRERQFIVGPNASGKSNLLDIFRFLRDIVKTDGGGFQKAVKDRGGVSSIRCLAARRDPGVAIEVHLADNPDAAPTWRYALEFRQEQRGYRRTLLNYERVWKNGEQILNRPDANDNEDPERITQTFLEQVNVNAEFREIAHFFRSVTYLHLVPQLLRFAGSIQGNIVEEDPFGQGFLERIAKANDKTRLSRLKKIENALKIAVPQLQRLEFLRDEVGRPHLRANYEHWRARGGWQQEDQFSDGTLRLLGLLWVLLESDSVLLLEEPELSLNAGIVSQLAPLISRMQKSGRCQQVFVSTHSDALLTDAGIDGREVLVLKPMREGTTVELASEIESVRALLEAGLTVGEVVPERVTEQLRLL